MKTEINKKYLCKLTVADIRFIATQKTDIKDRLIVVINKVKNQISCVMQLKALVKLDFIQLKSTTIKDDYDINNKFDFWCYEDPHTVTQVLSAGLK